MLRRTLSASTLVALFPGFIASFNMTEVSFVQLLFNTLWLESYEAHTFYSDVVGAV
jgi:hypothetical protein